MCISFYPPYANYNNNYNYNNSYNYSYIYNYKNININKKHIQKSYTKKSRGR